MALKRSFTEEEKVGLSNQEVEIGERYLRKHKTAGSIDNVKALRLYEMYLIGSSFHEIEQQFPQYELGQIILTAALNKWGMDRERMQGSLRERVKAKVVKSVIDQVDFLTGMLSVATAEHMNQMRKYAVDPDNEAVPPLRIKTIKEYKEVVETLAKIVQGATPNAKNNNMSPMFDALSSDSPESTSMLESQDKEQHKNEDEDIIDLDKILDQEEKGE